MINGRKILVIFMTLVLMTVGVNCIHASETNNGESSNLQENEYKVGIVTLESILSLHPELESLYQDYQEELEELENNASDENKAEDIQELKEKYIAQLSTKIQGELDQFTKKLGLDSLLIDNTIVSGNTDLNPEDLANIKDVTQYLETYLAKSN